MLTASPTDIRTATAMCAVSDALARCSGPAERAELLRCADHEIGLWLLHKRPGFDINAMVRVRRLIGDMARQQAARVDRAA
jgi:hypothetical protein